jgi:N-acetylneuraminic acid mutarotase
MRIHCFYQSDWIEWDANYSRIESSHQILSKEKYMNRFVPSHRASTTNSLGASRKHAFAPRLAASLALICIAVTIVCLLCPAAQAQSNEWTWMGGSSSFSSSTSGWLPTGQVGNIQPGSGQPGVYGTLGTPAAGNSPGGRSGAVTWTDASGNLWLFGGAGFDSAGTGGYLNDLWEFNPATQEWVWMDGPSTISCADRFPCGNSTTSGKQGYPGGRYGAAGWTDASGNLWLFGGEGFDQNGAPGYSNDLWMFSPTAAAGSQWTLVTGSPSALSDGGEYGFYGAKGVPGTENTPGARFGAATWTDSNGFLWLFGGYGGAAEGNIGYLNDLWEFDPSNNEWTWMGGSSKLPNTSGESGQSGNYNCEASVCVPGSRQFASSWVDGNGNLWLFGGYGFDVYGHEGGLGDLWEFNPSTGTWSFPSGYDTANQAPSYGTLGSFSGQPGGRFGAASWADSDGNFWLFGGTPFPYGGYFNDLWEFSVPNKQWAWMNGSKSENAFGVYGTLGTPAAANTPGSRNIAQAWADNNGRFWLFGGAGDDASSIFGDFNDLWSYQPTPLITTTTTVTATNTTYGNSAQLSIKVAPAAPDELGTPPDGETVSVMSGTTVVGTGFLGGGSSSVSLAPKTPGLNGLVPGTYSFTAVYGGDRDFAASTSSAASLVISKATNSLVLTTAATPTSAGSLATFTATFQNISSVALSPSGVVTFKSGTTVLGTAPIMAGNASNNYTTSAVFAYPSLPVGTSSITAVYAGDSNYNAATSSAVSQVVTAQVLSEWTWMSGSSSENVNGAYGTLGAAAEGNAPGSRDGAVSWISDGHLFLFGGYGYLSSTGDGALNDLWEYFPATDQWEWVSGSSTLGQSGVYGTAGTAAAANTPGARNNASSWRDSSLNLWLFGGSGVDSKGDAGNLNDLWEFNPSTEQWTWVGGSNTAGVSGVYGTRGTAAATNIPGARSGAVSWTDTTGHFWLFGGNGIDSKGNVGYLNDLWEFTLSTKEWTWVGGSSTVGASGVYGTLGTAAAANIPGSREASVSWIDSSGHLWLLGGSGTLSDGTVGYMNDLWEFNPSTKQWTWVGGSSAANQSGLYGTLGTAAAGNAPGGRLGAVSWIDAAGSLWLFGGYGYDSTVNNGYLNDFWEFSPSTKEWTWVGGSNLVNAAGVDGTLGLPSASTVPSARSGGAGWNDGSAHLWLFGGQHSSGYLNNDLWKYSLPASSAAVAPKPAFSLAAGTYVTAQSVAISESLKGATIHYTTDGTAPTASSPAYTTPITVSKTTTLQAIAVAKGVAPSAVTKATYNVNSPSAVSPKPRVSAGVP